MAADIPAVEPGGSAPPGNVTLFLCGDVMTGRGIDQILRRPSSPELFEPYVRSAVDYVELAERASGQVPRRVDSDYVWGDALGELARVRPDARIVNLETAVTTADEPWPGKGIHYRMHPANVPCLTALGIDCCVLANNHVIDWGHAGLAETLATLRAAGLRTAGAGADAAEAGAPAIIEVAGERRVLVFAFATPDSGVPPQWAARADRGGVNLLPDLSAGAIDAVARAVQGARRAGDIVVLSVHWGGNWGYRIADAQRRFAHAAIDAGVDVVHGHSSHHVKGIEVYRNRLVLYGCGDFLNDYEGIGGYEDFRADLALMYLPVLDPAGGLVRLVMLPTRTQRFRIGRVHGDDAAWLEAMLTREGRDLHTAAARDADDVLTLRWSARS